MKEHIKILKKFKEDPYGVLNDDKDRAKLIDAINKSIKLIHKHMSTNQNKNH